MPKIYTGFSVALNLNSHSVNVFVCNEGVSSWLTLSLEHSIVTAICWS